MRGWYLMATFTIETSSKPVTIECDMIQIDDGFLICYGMPAGPDVAASFAPGYWSQVVRHVAPDVPEDAK